MIDNFKYSLKRVLNYEGGWSDHKDDPGGATMRGITLNTFKAHYGADMTKNDLRNITMDQIEYIYKSGYWDKCFCDNLPSGVDFAVFDAAVNSGVRRSSKWLQTATGSKADGYIGSNTLKSVLTSDTTETIGQMCLARLTFMQRLSTWNSFGKGWSKRVLEVLYFALLIKE